MKYFVKLFLSIFLCVLCALSAFSCKDTGENSIGGEEWMDVARIEVAFGDEVRLFTSEARKKEIKALVDEIKTGAIIEAEPSTNRVDGEYDMLFVDFLTGEERKRLYRLTSTTLFDITNGTAYAVTEVQREALVAIFTLTPTPGQTL